mgnify:FL=1
MELGISIFGVLVLVLLLLAFFSAIFAIAVIFALVASIFFTWSILLQNIESLGVLDAVFLSSVSIFLVSSFITLFGKFTIVPPKVYQTDKPRFRVRVLNFTILVLLSFAAFFWYGFEKILFIQESFLTIPI